MVRPASKQVSASNYTTSNFEICPDSRAVFHKMKREGVGEESLKSFLLMEDRFLEHEKETVCRGRDRVLEATHLDQIIKSTFAGFDFTYHHNHLKQIHEPLRTINPYLNCLRV